MGKHFSLPNSAELFTVFSTCFFFRSRVIELSPFFRGNFIFGKQLKRGWIYDTFSVPRKAPRKLSSCASLSSISGQSHNNRSSSDAFVNLSAIFYLFIEFDGAIQDKFDFLHFGSPLDCLTIKADVKLRSTRELFGKQINKPNQTNYPEIISRWFCNPKI